MKRNMKIIGIWRYFPNNIVTAQDIDNKLSLPKGWTFKKSGVSVRHYVEGKTASYMGAMAATEALQDAGVSLDDIDIIFEY